MGLPFDIFGVALILFATAFAADHEFAEWFLELIHA